MLERTTARRTARFRRRHTPSRAGGGFERLDGRAMLAIGAYDVPQRDLGDYSQFGVAGVGDSTGTLMANGRHVVIAAHVIEVFRDSDTGDWEPIDVTFYSEAGVLTTVQIPGDNVHVHPSWRTSPREIIAPGGADGVDIALLELLFLAPYGNGTAGKGFGLRTAPLADTLGRISALTEGRLDDDANPARVLVARGAGNPFAGGYEIMFWNRPADSCRCRVGRVRQWMLRPDPPSTELVFAQHAAFAWGIRMS